FTAGRTVRKDTPPAANRVSSPYSAPLSTPGARETQTIATQRPYLLNVMWCVKAPLRASHPSGRDRDDRDGRSAILNVEEGQREVSHTTSARRAGWAVPTCTPADQQSNADQQMSLRNR